MRLHLLFLATILSVASPVNAALIDRGHGLIYDSATNLTWLQDVNYARTSGFKGVDRRDEFGRVEPSVDAYGRMNWDEAMRFARDSTYGGFDDWRLPTQGGGPLGYGDFHSEISVLFHNGLGNHGAFVDGVYQSQGFGLQNKGPFIFDNTDTFWTGDLPHNGGYVSVYSVYLGASGLTPANDLGAHYGAWLVRDGDVIAVPEPNTSLLVLSLLGGLLLQRRRYACSKA